jgi:hypothetical protein
MGLLRSRLGKGGRSSNGGTTTSGGVSEEGTGATGGGGSTGGADGSDAAGGCAGEAIGTGGDSGPKSPQDERSQGSPRLAGRTMGGLGGMAPLLAAESG